jgi:hypothetical protein
MASKVSAERAHWKSSREFLRHVTGRVAAEDCEEGPSVARALSSRARSRAGLPAVNSPFSR